MNNTSHTHGHTIFSYNTYLTLCSLPKVCGCAQTRCRRWLQTAPLRPAPPAGRGGAGTEPGGAERRNVVAAGKSINLFFAGKQRV